MKLQFLFKNCHLQLACSGSYILGVCSVYADMSMERTIYQSRLLYFGHPLTFKRRTLDFLRALNCM
jgi:hypothetical protein